jgi:alpha-glucosidase
VADPASTLSLYRQLLAERRRHGLGGGALEWLPEFGKDVVAFRNGNVIVVANIGSAPMVLPHGSVIAASGPLTGGSLPGDTTVWLAAG